MSEQKSCEHFEQKPLGFAAKIRGLAAAQPKTSKHLPLHPPPFGATPAAAGAVPTTGGAAMLPTVSKAMSTTILRSAHRVVDPPILAPGDRVISVLRPFNALVIFTDARHLWSARLLKPGFRHCFVLVDKGSCWLLQDPLAHHTDISVLAAAPEHEIAAFYLKLGYRVVPSSVRSPIRRPLPPALFTCVEAVKRVLGLRAWWVFTPWQLYRYLKDKT